eukprot:1435335-Rhodomonas_salina.1
MRRRAAYQPVLLQSLFQEAANGASASEEAGGPRGASEGGEAGACTGGRGGSGARRQARASGSAPRSHTAPASPRIVAPAALCAPEAAHRTCPPSITHPKTLRKTPILLSFDDTCLCNNTRVALVRWLMAQNYLGGAAGAPQGGEEDAQLLLSDVILRPQNEILLLASTRRDWHPECQ